MSGLLPDQLLNIYLGDSDLNGATEAGDEDAALILRRLQMLQERLAVLAKFSSLREFFKDALLLRKQLERMAKNALETLEEVREALQIVHHTHMVGNIKSEEYEQAVAPLGQAVEAVLSTLSSINSTKDDQVKAINRFTSFATQWTKERHLTALTLSDPFSSLDKKNRASKKELCPLERAFVENHIPPEDHYPINWFTTWAFSETSLSDVHSRIGSLRSVHLYRERNTLLHHEYALFCLGNDSISSHSWLKVERAAEKTNEHWYAPHLRSIGPLFGGARLREDVSMGRTKQSLIPVAADELAAVVLDSSAISAPDNMSIASIASQLNELSSTSPLYRLFSENCRFFARNNLGLVVNRIIQNNLSCSTSTWLGEPQTLTAIQQALLGDPFGGKQLAGTRGDLIRVEGVLRQATECQERFLHQQTVHLCNRALTLLDSIKDENNTPRRMILTAIAQSCMGNAFRSLGDLDRSLELHQSACRLIPIQSDSTASYWTITHNDLASTLFSIGRSAEALSMRKEIITSVRAFVTPSDINKRKLSLLVQVLINYALDLAVSRTDASTVNSQERLNVLEEAIFYAKQLADSRPDLHNQSYAMALDEKARILNALGRYSESFLLSRDAVVLFHQQFLIHPTLLLDHLLTSARSNVGHAESAREKSGEALQATQDMLRFTKRYLQYPPDNNTIRPRLAELYMTHANHLILCGMKAPRILGVIKQGIEAYKSSPSITEETRVAFALFLANLALHASANNLTEVALKASREATILSRQSFSNNPTSYDFRNTLAIYLYNHSVFASRFPNLVEETILTALESIEFRRQLVAEKPASQQHRLELANSLELYGNTLRRMDRMQEAFEPLKESLELYVMIVKGAPDPAVWGQQVGSSALRLGSFMKEAQEKGIKLPPYQIPVNVVFQNNQ